MFNWFDDTEQGWAIYKLYSIKFVTRFDFRELLLPNPALNFPGQYWILGQNHRLPYK
jgi:hypothetical protein